MSITTAYNMNLGIAYACIATTGLFNQRYSSFLSSRGGLKIELMFVGSSEFFLDPRKIEYPLSRVASKMLLMA